MNYANIFDNITSLDDLLKCREILNNKIADARKAHRDECKTKCVRDFVKTHNKFVSTDDSGDILYSGIRAELESLELDCSSGGTDTKWLANTNLPYSWSAKSGKVFTNEPVCINQYKCIQNLLVKINSTFNVDLNSCLVTYYRDGRSGLRPHSDNEKSMDPLSPISVFSVGSDRQIHFYSQYQASSEAPVLSITPGEGSLYIMEPGCQSYFYHKVPSTRQSGPRFSLSFRKRVPDNPESPVLIPVSCDTPKQSTVNTSVNNKQEVVIKKKKTVLGDDDSVLKRKNTTVLFGTSLTTGVIGKKLGERGRKCINVSKSGARISDISEMVDDFYNISNDVDDIEKIIFSFGTNDIKHEKFGVAKFRQPVAKLIQKTKYYFPGATIFIQSTLPIRNTNQYCAPNFIGFNNILRDVCYKYNCYYIDCFDQFVSPDGYDHDFRFFRDHYHLNKVGLGILCRLFKMLINNDSFNNTIKYYDNRYN